MTKINIVMVDDHRIFRDGIKSLLSEVDFIEVVGEASGGEELLQLLSHIRPDIVITDISMKGISGIELTKQVICLYPKIR